MIDYDGDLFRLLTHDSIELRMIGEAIISNMEREDFSEVLEQYLQLRACFQFRKSTTDLFWFKALEFKLHYRLKYKSRL